MGEAQDSKSDPGGATAAPEPTPDAFKIAEEALEAAGVTVSQVCVVNNGGFALRWSVHDCPAHSMSPDSGIYPIDMMRCVHLDPSSESYETVVTSDEFGVKQKLARGDKLRLAIQVMAGLHEIPDPALTY